MLEWVAVFFSRESFRPRDRTQVSCIAGRFFTTDPPGESSLPPITFISCLSFKAVTGKGNFGAVFKIRRHLFALLCVVSLWGPSSWNSTSIQLSLPMKDLPRNHAFPKGPIPIPWASYIHQTQSLHTCSLCSQGVDRKQGENLSDREWWVSLGW